MRRVADVVLLRTGNGRKSGAKRVDDFRRVVHRQRRLGHEGEILGIVDLELVNVFRPLDEIHPRAVAVARLPLAQCALHFRMSGVPDENRVTAGFQIVGHLHVDLCHEGTGCIENLQTALVRLPAHGLRHAMSAEYDGGAIRHLS